MKIHKIFSLAKTKVIYYNSVEAEMCFFVIVDMCM